MINTVYENTETAVISFLSKLIENAIDPYTTEIEGNFKLDSLKQKLQKSLEDAVTLINAWGYPENDSRMHDISLICAKRMCAHINDEVFSLFSKHSEGTFFMIDFNAFSGRISDMLFKEFTVLEGRNKFSKN